MIIDKTTGNWCKDDDSDYIDDVAFQLYLNYFYDEYGEHNKESPQYNFKNIRHNSNSYWYSYYTKAFKIIRLEKLNKLNNDVNI